MFPFSIASTTSYASSNVYLDKDFEVCSISQGHPFLGFRSLFTTLIMSSNVFFFYHDKAWA